MDTTWDSLHEQLTAWLESLQDGESVVLGEPVVPGGPRAAAHDAAVIRLHLVLRLAQRP